MLATGPSPALGSNWADCCTCQLLRCLGDHPQLRISLDEVAIDAFISVCHVRRSKTALKPPAYCSAIHPADLADRLDRACHVLDHISSNIVIDDFGDRSAVERDGRRSAGEGLDH